MNDSFHNKKKKKFNKIKENVRKKEKKMYSANSEQISGKSSDNTFYNSELPQPWHSYQNGTFITDIFFNFLLLIIIPIPCEDGRYKAGLHPSPKMGNISNLKVKRH